MLYIITVTEDGELVNDFVGHGIEARTTAEDKFTEWCETAHPEGITAGSSYYEGCREAMEDYGFDVFAREVELPEWSRL